ncbi:hypothetical protein CMK18_08480 [Candidatus Poribacteria bacterium]|nr:hypothetical protein [Candidatus Poribacteria bacterium]
MGFLKIKHSKKLRILIENSTNECVKHSYVLDMKIIISNLIHQMLMSETQDDTWTYNFQI